MKDSYFSKLRITNIYIIYVIILMIIGVIVMVGSRQSEKSIVEMQEFTKEYSEGQSSINELMDASDYLTEKARAFVVSGEEENAHLYREEVEVNKRRDRSLAKIKSFKVNEQVYSSLESALRESNELAETECYAMLLAATARGVDKEVYESFTGGAKLSKKDKALSNEEKQEKAVDLVFNEDYENKKAVIKKDVEDSLDELMDELKDRQVDSYREATRLARRDHALFLAVLLMTFVLIFITAFMVIIPIRKSTRHILEHEALDRGGSYEYDVLADAYNNMLQTSKKHQEKLSYEATHDELTGLHNRKLFEQMKEELSGQDIAMLIIDVDRFKGINDTYGHETGDKVLQKVASTLASAFRGEDYVCRIGGDEFAVIMRQMTPDLKGVIKAKINRVQEKLLIKDDLPKVTLSIGAAFEKDKGPDENLFKKADKALYSVKATGRDSYAFYDEL